MLNISMLEVAKNYGIIKNYFMSDELNDWKEKFKRNTITKTTYGDNCWGIDVNCLSYLWFKKVVLSRFLKFLDPNVKLIFASYIDCFTTFPVHTDVKLIPNNKLLIETDSPYLAPVPFRGKKNEPSFIKYTLEKLAEIKDMKLRDIEIITNNNFNTLFS